MPARVRRIATLAAALTLPAFVIATQLYVGYRMRGVRVAFGAALATQLCHWELWTIAGPIVWNLARRWPLDPLQRSRSLVRHAMAAPVVATGVLAADVALYEALGAIPALSAWFVDVDRSVAATMIFFLVSFFHLELLVYASIVAVAHAVRSSTLLRAREHDTLQLEAELTNARLSALRTQLQPHFLFNTLHTIGSLVLQRQHDAAVRLLAELGELLRETLAQRDTDLTPLRSEIAYLRKYLNIEEARFGDRLKIEWDLQAEAEAALIPPFLLQPLVENALRHGIARRTDDSVLRIGTRIDDDDLSITIYNDGPSLTASPSTNGGYGLTNVSERLRMRRPAGHLTLADTAGGVTAIVRLPGATADRR